MKQIFIILSTLIFSLVSVTAMAQKKVAGSAGGKAFKREYGMAGCGLGSVLIGKHGGQIFAATTNGTLSNQLFGISAGTLNCVDSPSSEVASRLDQFILVNRSQVQGDVARGNGETIAALADVMGCSQQSSEVGQSLKQNYKQIFEETSVTNEITDSIIHVIKTSPNLSAQCKQLG